MVQVIEVGNKLEEIAPSEVRQSRRLHLGCFDCPASSWINTDITPHIWVARVPGFATLLFHLRLIGAERYKQHRQGVFRHIRYMNVAKRFPYPADYFDAVFSSHMLEHLQRQEAQSCLSEVFRTLRPGGVCRIVVPDLDLLVRNYDPERPDVFLEKLYEPSNTWRQKNSHHWLYNGNSLITLLYQVGFREAYRCNYREGHCPDVEILDNRPKSLFVEGLK